MTGDVLLDTTVAVAHLRGVATVSERLAQASTRYLSTVALGELHFGLSETDGVSPLIAILGVRCRRVDRDCP